MVRFGPAPPKPPVPLPNPPVPLPKESAPSQGIGALWGGTMAWGADSRAALWVGERPRNMCPGIGSPAREPDRSTGSGTIHRARTG